MISKKIVDRAFLMEHPVSGKLVERDDITGVLFCKFSGEKEFKPVLHFKEQNEAIAYMDAEGNENNVYEIYDKPKKPPVIAPPVAAVVEPEVNA